MTEVELTGRQKRFFGLIVGLLMTAGGGYATYDHYTQQQEARAVDAVVERSYVPIDAGDQGGSEPFVEYRYTIDGTEYTSSQLCPVAAAQCAGDPDKVVEEYAEGETVTAYVDRTNPEDAYLLKPGPPYGFLFLTGFGVLVLLLTRLEPTEET